ncbi:hypothetical protein ACTFIZ_010048 [Dictyostelium cf. discoideum]
MKPTKMDDYLFKIILVGEGNVGKSSMIERFVDDNWNDTYTETTDHTFKEKYIYLNENTIKLQIWDLQRSKMVYRGIQGIILVYDCTNQDSFYNIRRWLGEIERYAREDVNLLLVGNKIDLYDQKVVSTEQVNSFLQQFSYFNMKLIEVSAKTNINLEQCFTTITNDILNRHLEDSKCETQNSNNNNNNKPRKKSSFCVNQ